MNKLLVHSIAYRLAMLQALTFIQTTLVIMLHYWDKTIEIVQLNIIHIGSLVSESMGVIICDTSGSIDRSWRCIYNPYIAHDIMKNKGP